MMSFFVKSASLLTIIGTVFTLSACGGEDELADRLGTSDPSVRFINASPGTVLSLFKNGWPQPDDLNDRSYAQISKFKDFNDENTTFSARWASEQGALAVNEAGSAGSFRAVNGHRYLAVAFSQTVSTTNNFIDLQVWDDPYNRKMSIQPTVRIVNAVFSDQRFDLYVTRPDQELSNPVIANFGYKSIWPASGSDSHKLEDANGKFRIRITAAGNPGEILFDSKQIKVSKNADAVIVLALADGFRHLINRPFRRGDLNIYIDDGNNKDEKTQKIIDQI